MWKKSAFLACFAFAFVATSSAIAAPSIVGTYAVEVVTVCPPTLDLASGKLSAAGFFDTWLVTMTFNSAGTVAFSGYADAGSPVLATNNTYHGGNALTEVQPSNSTAYSNTATTFTFGAPTPTNTFHALYNNVNSAGQAGGFMWMGIYPVGSGNECSQRGTAVRQ